MQKYIVVYTKYIAARLHNAHIHVFETFKKIHAPNMIKCEKLLR